MVRISDFPLGSPIMVVPPPKQGDGAVSGILHMLHSHDGQEMSCCQAVCRGIKANVEGHFLFSQQVPDLASWVACSRKPRSNRMS